MTVKELIERLENFDENTEVIFVDYEPVVDVIDCIDSDCEKEYCVITDR